MNKTSIITATALASMLLAAASAFAGEANYEPFPLYLQTAPVTVGVATADVGSNNYPAPNPAFAVASLAQQTLPELGTNGPVQSANSMPPNFEVGTPQYAQAVSTNRWFAQQAQNHYAQEQLRAARRNAPQG